MMMAKRKDVLEIDLDETEFEVKSKKATRDDDKFDHIVGALEDLLLDDEFIDLQQSLTSKYAHDFDEKDENKLVYTEIFSKYTMQLESFIGRKLQVALPWFDMKDFLKMLEKRQDQIDGDVFDMLSTLGDFQAFKEMMLSYKSEQDGTAVDFSDLMVVHRSK